MTPEEQRVIDAVSTKLTSRFYVGQRVQPLKEYSHWYGIVTAVEDSGWLHMYAEHEPDETARYDPQYFEPAP